MTLRASLSGCHPWTGGSINPSTTTSPQQWAGATKSLFDLVTGDVKQPLLAVLTRTFAPAVAVASAVPAPAALAVAPAASMIRQSFDLSTGACCLSSTAAGAGP